MGVNKSTGAYRFHRLRTLIYEAEEEQTPFSGEIEVDESYFGGKRKGVQGIIPVFGLLKRGGKVYAKVILDAKSATLIPIMQEKILPDSIVYTDCFSGYNVLDVSDFKYYLINHSEVFADKMNRLNSIGNF